MDIFKSLLRRKVRKFNPFFFPWSRFHFQVVYLQWGCNPDSHDFIVQSMTRVTIPRTYTFCISFRSEYVSRMVWIRFVFLEEPAERDYGFGLMKVTVRNFSRANKSRDQSNHTDRHTLPTLCSMQAMFNFKGKSFTQHLFLVR